MCGDAVDFCSSLLLFYWWYVTGSSFYYVLIGIVGVFSVSVLLLYSLNKPGSIKHFCLTDWCCLVWSFRMLIYVRSPTSRTICLKVRPSDTLNTIKAKILEQHHLVFDGVQLEDNITLAEYGIEHQSTIDLQEKMQTYVKIVTTRNFLNMINMLTTSSWASLRHKGASCACVLCFEFNFVYVWIFVC